MDYLKIILFAIGIYIFILSLRDIAIAYVTKGAIKPSFKINSFMKEIPNNSEIKSIKDRDQDEIRGLKDRY